MNALVLSSTPTPNSQCGVELLSLNLSCLFEYLTNGKSVPTGR